MKQTLHILRKDVRHLWIEICVSILAVSAYIWRVLYEWGHPFSVSDVPDFLQGLLTALGPISWCVLIVRAVQDESLVGDRQFWVTRPYEWKKLLAAKALFVVLFVNLPLFIANVIFLKKSGFPPTRYLIGLLSTQLSVIVILVLTVVSISVVTATIVQVILWALGIGAYIAAIVSISGLIPDSHIATSTDRSDLYSMGAFGVACAGIVLWQYSQRRPWIARGVILGLAVLVAGGSLVPTTQKQIAQAYPLLSAGEQPPFHIMPTPPKPSAEDENQTQAGLKKIDLAIPIQFTSVAEGSLVVVAGTHVAIRTKNRDEVATKWISDGWEIWPGEQKESVPVEIDRSFFEQSRFVPADLRITLAFTEYQERRPRQIVTSQGEFPVDGIGICWVTRPSTYYRGLMECRSPVMAPPVLARYETSMSTCPRVRHKMEVPPTTGYAAYLNDTSGPVDPAIIPIQTFTLFFSEPDDRDENTVVPGVCPGTPIILSIPAITRHGRTEIEINGADLRDYVSPPPQVRIPRG